MLLYVNEEKLIYGYNEYLSKEESAQYIANGAIWIDELVIEPPTLAIDEVVKMYYLNNKVEYVIEKAEVDSPEKLSEIVVSTHEKTRLIADDSMINMDMLLELDEKINTLLDHLGIDY